MKKTTSQSFAIDLPGFVSIIVVRTPEPFGFKTQNITELEFQDSTHILLFVHVFKAIQVRGRAGGLRLGGEGGRGGRLHAAALVGGRCAVRFLDLDSLRTCVVGRLLARSPQARSYPKLLHMSYGASAIARTSDRGRVAEV